MRIRHTLLLVFVSCPGCVHVAPPVPEKTTVKELNRHPQQYHGDTVVVRGYLTLHPQAHNIFESKTLAMEFRRRWDEEDPSFDPTKYDRYCLTIANPDALMERRKALNDSTIVAKGTFLADYLDGKIDLGACALPTGILIDIDDLKRRYPSIFAR